MHKYLKIRTTLPFVYLCNKAVICCELDIGYFSKEWNILEEKVRALNIEHNFKEIFIYDSSTEKSFTMS
ncbi:hypothetical protein CDG55_01280 [Acinetobacter sp. WCHA45]|nr:hypothetical protein CDG55_01280 [Acinetobacter sp. WCHA45]